MIRAWYMDSSDADQREEHKCPDRLVGDTELYEKTGVEYFQIQKKEELDEIRKKRNYNFEDEIVIREGETKGYEEKLKMFFKEHLHIDEEIRYCVEGSGYFDVRDQEDSWIRVKLEKGDMIILPAGIYHRFTLDTKNYIKAKRYFSGVPVWTPYNRSAGEHPAHAAYKKLFGK